VKAIVFVACTIMAISLPAWGTVSRVTQVEAARSSLTPHACQNVQLLIRSSQSQGAAGHIAVIYRMTNLWNQPCTLYGYPGVQLLDRNFHSLPTHVHRGPGNLIGAIIPRLVRLGSYGHAYFAMGYSDVPVNNQPCPNAYYLMIIPPNDYLPVVTAAVVLGGIYRSQHKPSPITVCTGNVNVTPVTKRPRFQ
jgi:Protein of unknown function (DUF4232)